MYIHLFSLYSVYILINCVEQFYKLMRYLYGSCIYDRERGEFYSNLCQAVKEDSEKNTMNIYQ